jgi:hypothetical protein
MYNDAKLIPLTARDFHIHFFTACLSMSICCIYAMNLYIVVFVLDKSA